MHCSEDSQDDRDRLEMVAAILTESLEHPLFPREQMNEQAKHLRAQMKHILNLIEEWNYQTLDARRIEDLARDARFLRCQTGQILRLVKQQIEETEGQRKQLAAHGDILQNILLNVAPEPSQSPMYVHPRITWKSVFKCECQSAKHTPPPEGKGTCEHLDNVEFNFVSTTLQNHFDVTLVLLRVHTQLTLMSHRLRIGFTAASFEIINSSVSIWMP